MEAAEEWREIPGLGGWYEASSLGRVRSWVTPGPKRVRRTTPRVLQPTIQANGRVFFTLYVEGRGFRRMVHRAVAAAFGLLDGLADPLLIDHIDGNPRNNRLSNLRPATRSQNQRNYHNPKSGYSGVRYDSSSKQWRTHFKVESGPLLHLGQAKCPTRAALLRDIGVLELGQACEFTHLNFPDLRGGNLKSLRKTLKQPQPPAVRNYAVRLSDSSA